MRGVPSVHRISVADITIIHLLLLVRFSLESLTEKMRNRGCSENSGWRGERDLVQELLRSRVSSQAAVETAAAGRLVRISPQALAEREVVGNGVLLLSVTTHPGCAAALVPFHSRPLRVCTAP